MELEKRLVAVYVGASVVFPLMAEGLKYQGAADSSNPAWVLISTIRNILVATWILGLLVFLVRAWLRANEQAAQEWERQKKAKEESESEARRKEEEARAFRYRTNERLEKLERLEHELQRYYDDKLAERELQRQEEEEKRNRTHEDAIELVLEDFG